MGGGQLMWIGSFDVDCLLWGFWFGVVGLAVGKKKRQKVLFITDFLLSDSDGGASGLLTNRH